MKLPKVTVKKGAATLTTKRGKPNFKVRSVSVGKTGVAYARGTKDSRKASGFHLHNGPLKSKPINRMKLSSGKSSISHTTVNAKHAAIGGAGVAGAVGVHHKRGNRSINKHPMRRPRY